ncbi:hypothetical protein GCM10009810_35060 [Nostocoides vanveenii]|uniref:Uncharacterized protein n=1 Tax=Nostocoides vanveenii TaxID=330835 RepID=A0ABN2L4Z0_9MICO
MSTVSDGPSVAARVRGRLTYAVVVAGAAALGARVNTHAGVDKFTRPGDVRCYVRRSRSSATAGACVGS